MKNRIIINIPKDNVNDEECRLIELTFNNGDKINKGDVIAVFETSKATFDITAEVNGYIYFTAALNDVMPIGSPFCIISKNQEKNHDYEKLLDYKDDEIDINKNNDKIISKSALSLIKKYSINIDLIEKDGLIKKSDVENFLNKKTSLDKRIESLIVDQKKENIIIVGAGGHAKMIIDIINDLKEFNLIGIVDAGSIIGANTEASKSILGIPIICDYSQLDMLYKKGIKNAINAVGFIDSHKEREMVFNKLIDIGFNLPNIIHRTAIIEPSVKLGSGNHILANSLIGSASTIGDNSIINSGSIITHDVNIKNNVHITPGVLIAGYVKISSNTIIGMGSTLHFKINIGSNVKIHNGSNIIGDITNNSIIKNG